MTICTDLTQWDSFIHMHYFGSVQRNIPIKYINLIVYLRSQNTNHIGRQLVLAVFNFTIFLFGTKRFMPASAYLPNMNEIGRKMRPLSCKYIFINLLYVICFKLNKHQQRV